MASRAGPDDPRAWVPHRPPILSVDRVIAYGIGWAEAERDVGEDWDVEDGAAAGAGLIESLAQTAAVMNHAAHCGGGRSVRRGMLVGVRDFVVHRAPRVGETVRLRVDLLRRLAPLTLATGVATVGDERIAEGALKFYIEIGEDA